LFEVSVKPFEYPTNHASKNEPHMPE